MSNLPLHTRDRRRPLAAVVLALLTVVLLPPVARAATVEVRIGAALSPAAVEVAPGTTVTWVNDHDERHRIRATDGPEEFDSGNLEPGERFSHTFTAEGTTRYVDDRDRDDTAYHGTVVVRAAAPDPSPSPTAGPTPDEPTGPTTHTVGMRDRRFTPARLDITTGDTVRFLNDDDRDHTATADDGSFDSGILAAGRAFDRTFSRAGTFSYLCLLHPDMVGTIAVADPGSTAPPPAPAPAPAPAPSEPAPAPASTPAPSTGGGTPTAPQRVTVEMRDFTFAPGRVEVPAGSTVVFRNTGRALHTATADDGSFDSDLVASGGTYERRFDRAGTFAYTCLLHPEMVGTVVVTAAASGSTATGAAPTSTVSEGTAATGGGAGPSTTSAPRAAPGTVVVSLDDFVFSPSDVRLTVGDTVRFRNDGAALHTATARDGSYDSGLLRPGGIAEHTFQQAGTFAWWCTLHPEMVATIRVADAAGEVPDAEVLSDSLSATDGTDVAAGPGTAGGADGSATSDTSVSMVDNEFLPEVLEVAVGAEVTWSNDGAAVHTVTADDGAFDSGLVAPGATFAATFDEIGTITYSCIVHPGMVGEVRVLALSDAGSGVDEAATGAAGAELSTVRLQLFMLGAFAVALAGFTALARRVGERDVEVH